MYRILQMDNMKYELNEQADIVFCDFVYENLNFQWVDKYWNFIKDGGILIAMCDFHSQHRYRCYMEDHIHHSNFVNHLVNKCEWGNHPKDRFHQCYDDIIIYSKGKNYKFYSEKIQVPKKTLTKGLNPSGRTTKTATAWIDDCTLTTTAKERIKEDNGHLVKWQKPMSLMNRILNPFATENCLIVDPFMGSGTCGEYAILNNMNYVGIEYDKEVFKLAEKRLKKIYDEKTSGT